MAESRLQRKHRGRKCKHGDKFLAREPQTGRLVCKKCKAEYSRAWNEKYKERHRRNMRAYRARKRAEREAKK